MIPYFWALLWSNRQNVFWQIDLLLSIVAAAAIAVLVDENVLRERYLLVLRTTGASTIGLLGLTLAGLALVVAQANDTLLRISQGLDRGVVEDYFPFSFTAFVAVITVLVSLFLIVITPEDDVVLMRIGIGFSIGFFSWTLFNILSLVRNVAQHGINRSLVASSEEKQEPD